MKKICPKTFAFTLIELLVVVSIIGILFGVGISAYNQFNRRQILVQAAKTLKGDLRLAQSMALAGEKPVDSAGQPLCTGSLTDYQVSFTENTYDISAICPNTVLVKSVSLPQNVTFSPVPTPILFKVLAQGVNGAQTINLTAFGGTPQTVTVTSSGDIY